MSIFLFINCNKNQQKELTPEEILDQTPEVLNDNTSDFNMSSISKRYGYDSDIISKLYEEALEKNDKLKLLDKKISRINTDSLNDRAEAYLKYSHTNNQYWSSTNQYIENLNDTILKEETLKIFKNLEEKYKNRIALHKQKFEEIKDRTLSINDRLILMKLIITQAMMENYQMNEMPDIQELEKLLKQYDQLIKETEAFTTINK